MPSCSGEGSFGRVLQARAERIVAGMPERNIVAVKTTKDNATSVEREELLAELDLMRNLEPHENILNLLGQCTTPGTPHTSHITLLISHTHHTSHNHIYHTSHTYTHMANCTPQVWYVLCLTLIICGIQNPRS